MLERYAELSWNPSSDTRQQWRRAGKSADGVLVTVVLAAFASAVTGMLAVIFYCELAAQALDYWRQRRFDAWHRAHLIRRLKGLAQFWARAQPVVARGRHDVSGKARRMRRSSWYRLMFWPYLLAIRIVRRLWRALRRTPSRAPVGRPVAVGRTTAEAQRLLLWSLALFVLSIGVFAIMPPMQEDAPGAFGFRADGQLEVVRPATSGSSDQVTVWLLVGFAILAFTVRTYRAAQRVTALSAAETRSVDPRPIVLFLRSFGDDQLRLRAHRSPHHPFVVRYSPARRDRIEEIIVDRLWRYGPVVAVGQPGVRQPPIGAAREQLPETEWKETVEQRMREATLVAVVLGRTAGLAWEVETLARLGLWDKVVWVLPPVNVPELERRWSATQSVLRAHGDTSLTLDADPGEVMVARSASHAGTVVYTSSRRNHWSYEAALEAATSGGSNR